MWVWEDGTPVTSVGGMGKGKMKPCFCRSLEIFLKAVSNTALYLWSFLYLIVFQVPSYIKYELLDIFKSLYRVSGIVFL